MPVVRGKVEETNDEIFAEVNYHNAYEPKRAVRTRRWKYIRRFEPRNSPVLVNIGDNPSRDVLMKDGLRLHAPDSEQLYDLIFDPNEACNLASKPMMAEVLQDMRDRLDRWMRSTNDPLLKGLVPAPVGALTNDPNDLTGKDATVYIVQKVPQKR